MKTKNNYLLWETYRPKYETLSREAKEYLRTHTQWEYREELEYRIKAGTVDTYTPFFRELGLDFDFLKMVSGFPEKTENGEVLESLGKDPDNHGSSDGYRSYPLEFSTAAKMWNNPELLKKFPPELLDICVLVDYGDNDFTIPMMSAGEKLSELIEGLHYEIWRYLESEEEYLTKHKDERGYSSCQTWIDYYIKELRLYLDPKKVLDLMKILFTGSRILDSADYWMSRESEEGKSEEDYIGRAIELREYLLGKPRETDLWSPGTSDTMIKIGTRAEVESWAIKRYAGYSMKPPKTLKEIDGNSEILIVSVYAGHSEVWTQ